MSEDIGEHCGIVLASSLHDVYNILKKEQHRGREAAGIGAYGENGIDVMKWRGRIDQISLDTLQDLFPQQLYFLFSGHNRYATKGRKEKVLEDAHPHTIGGQSISVNNHIIIRGADASIVHNGQVDYDHVASFIDSSQLKSECDSEAFLHLYKKIGEEKLMKTIPGAFSAIIFDRDKKDAVIVRDRHGIKPLWIAEKDGKPLVASETYALEDNGGRIIREVEPGEILYVGRNGSTRRLIGTVSPEPRFCFFERNYLQDSRSEGIRKNRVNLGKALAAEFNPGDIDVVTYTPRCPEFVALGYASGIGEPEKFLKLFYKLSEERSFMQSTQTEREDSIKVNLYMLDNVDVEGKNVMILDDSLVRGTVIAHSVRLAKSAGARKVYYGLATPPIGVVKNGVKHGCLYGVDMPPEPPKEDNFAVRKYGDGTGSSENIRQIELATGADKIFYVSEDRMFKALQMEKSKSCYFCIGGPKPF